jgi:hypothetical protein
MLAITMPPAVAAPAEERRPLSIPAAPESATCGVKQLGCSWVVDSATGTLRSQWGFGARR